MLKTMRIITITAAAVVLGWATTAPASQRTYVWTEEYGTLAKGNAEFEYWNTATTQDIQTRSASDWAQKVELEYGITDHFNVSLYQVFEQAADSKALTYVGYNVELKYRIAEANTLPVDVLLYVEHEVSTIEGGVNEGKIILAKDVGKLNIAYNQIYEKVASSARGDHGYAAGSSFELAPWLRFGIESTGSYTNGTYAAGPTIAWMGNRIWANIGAVYGLNRKTADRDVRFMMGIPF